MYLCEVIIDKIVSLDLKSNNTRVTHKPNRGQNQTYGPHIKTHSLHTLLTSYGKHTSYTKPIRCLHFGSGPHIKKTWVTHNFGPHIENTRVTHDPPNVPVMTSDPKEIWSSRRLEKRDTLKPK